MHFFVRRPVPSFPPPFLFLFLPLPPFPFYFLLADDPSFKKGPFEPTQQRPFVANLAGLFAEPKEDDDIFP